MKNRLAPAAVKKPVTALDLPPRQQEQDEQPVYRPVTTRAARVSRGEFQYVFRKGTDLFADGKEGLAYPELLGNFQIAANLGKHLLDAETAEDAHYEISPGEIDRLARLLEKKTNQKYPRSPEVGCACYLQRHTGWDLIALLKGHALIEREVHF